MKHKKCDICGLPGETKCTPQANCLNIPMAAEIKAKIRTSKKKIK